MTWKIKGIELAEEEPVFSLYDPKHRLYLEVELSSPQEVHLFLGADDPTAKECRLYIVVDKEGVQVEGTRSYDSRDVLIVDNILATMGIAREARRVALLPLRKALWQKRNPGCVWEDRPRRPSGPRRPKPRRARRVTSPRPHDAT